MPSTMIVKPRAAEATRKSKAPPDKSQRGPTASTGAQGPKPRWDRRARSTSAAPKPTGTKPAERSAGTEPERRRATSSVRGPDASMNPRDSGGGPGQKELRCSRAEGKTLIQSHKAFTVIPPNPKKRREIQKKAEAELAALEELRLSRAMAYVSIDPSSVGGCLSLEEVRLKQQQEMMRAKRKQKQVRTQQMEDTPVLTR